MYIFPLLEIFNAYYFIIVYYDRIAPYRGVVIKSISLSLSNNKTERVISRLALVHTAQKDGN